MNQISTLHHETSAAGILNISGLFEGLRDFGYKFAYVVRRTLAKTNTPRLPAYYVVKIPDHISEYVYRSGFLGVL